MGALLGIVILAACGEDGRVNPGDSLAGNGGLYAILPDVPVGQEWVTMNANLVNTSENPLTVRSVSVSGPGVGEVIEIFGTDLGPVPDDDDSLNYTTGGIFRTYPPAQGFDGGCHVQALVPVAGYVLKPGAQARILLLTRAVAPGRYSFGGVQVLYSRSGALWSETVDFGQRGNVVSYGKDVPPISRDERRCSDERDWLASGDVA